MPLRTSLITEDTDDKLNQGQLENKDIKKLRSLAVRNFELKIRTNKVQIYGMSVSVAVRHG
jgi:hypothetical protein